MARMLHYKILDESENRISDQEWEDVRRLQHWYNSEFIWTAGRLALKMFAVFPNWDGHEGDEKNLMYTIVHRKQALLAAGLSENAIIQRLADEGLILAKKGGYADNCHASGFTKVAGNEFNAYLVCEFFLKASLIAKETEFTVYDEGCFIKPNRIRIQNGVVRATVYDKAQENAITQGKAFSIVNSEKYDNFPMFKTIVMDYNNLEEREKLEVLRDWNWLGFGKNYDLNGDDMQGYDLNAKVLGFEIVRG